MAFCQNCGTPNMEGRSTCTSCNSPLIQTPPLQSFTPPPLPVALAAQATAMPLASQSQTAIMDSAAMPPRGSKYAVLSTGSIWGSVFLMNIPVIGWIVCLCWCFSKKINENRRNLARATLIFILLQMVWFAILFGIINFVITAITTTAQTMLDVSTSNIFSELDGISETLDKIISIFEFFTS